MKTYENLRFGCELECQSYDGRDENDYGRDDDPEVDEEATEENVRELLEDYKDRAVNDVLSRYGQERAALYLQREDADIYARLNKRKRIMYATYNQLIEQYGLDELDDLLERLTTCAQENSETVYYESDSCGSFVGFVKDNIRGATARHWEIEEDASVSGCEFVQRGGGSTYDDTMSAVAIINDEDFDADKECSFHVHLSERGVKHRYGINMQYLMCKYITDNLKTCPDFLLERWGGPWMSRYFKLQADEGKYNFVAFREEHGTWEFRAFGNVNTESDMKFCIDMAADAYIYAKKRLKFTRVGQPEWDRLQFNFQARLYAETNKRARKAA